MKKWQMICVFQMQRYDLVIEAKTMNEAFDIVRAKFNSNEVSFYQVKEIK